MSVSVEISPAVLAWVGQQISAENDTQITALLSRWMNKEEKPNTKTIRRVSQATHIPFGYFFLKYPPQEECDLIHCRTINSTSIKTQSRDFIDVYNSMLNVQNWMSEYNRETLGLEPLSFVGRYNENNSPMEIAVNIRHELELSEDFFIQEKSSESSFNYLRKRISESGILVMKNAVVGSNTHRKLDIKEFRAFTIINNYAPLIFINGNDTKTGKLFSLAHELAHIWIGSNSLFNDLYSNLSVSKSEQICNAVAAEILTPISIFKYKWTESKIDSIVKISILADVFHCSKLVIARRALDLKFINQKTYTEIQSQTRTQLETSPSDSKSKFGGGSFYNTLKSNWDKNFILALDYSTKAGTTPYLDAYRLTGFKSKTFQNLVAKLNQGQVEVT